MQHYIISFCLGMIIALMALILQVTSTMLMEIFFGMPYALQYGDTLSTQTWSLLTIAACTEEIIRFAIITKRMPLLPKNVSATLHGILLGSGFWFIEMCLHYVKNSADTFTLSAIIPLVIHIVISICICHSILRFPRHITISIAVLISAILLHIAGNLIIFVL